MNVLSASLPCSKSNEISINLEEVTSIQEQWLSGFGNVHDQAAARYPG